VGRVDPPPGAFRGLLQSVRMRQERHEVAPAFAVDPDKVRRLLEQLAPEVAEPPTDATLRLEGDQLIAIPGQPGQVLDVDATLEKIVTTVTHLGPDNRFTLTFRAEQPPLVSTDAARAQAEELINRQVEVSTYDVLTDEAFSWTLGRETVATWICVEQAGDGSGPTVRVTEEAVRATLVALGAELGGGRGFLLDEATSQVLDVFEGGGGAVELHMTHPPREYLVQPGDDLSSVAALFGMPPGLIGEANPDVDLNSLSVGQRLVIPPEDVLRPYATVPGKQIVISVAEQRMRVYADGEMLYEWPVSTGMAGSPTYTGHFQILSQEVNAYASQWDLWMPHFMAVYRAGGAVYNGIHALPILSSGQRLWEGALGSPASYGCIILGVEEAETLFNWAEIGVPVTIE
jgi:lipoprotein-anchoring transpeptidase ErfK/SrfK